MGSMSAALLGLGGGLGLFLVGMSILTAGLRELSGRAFAKLLARLTQSPLAGVLTGIGATVLLQSSSATTVAAVGFVGAGLISFRDALGLVLGANVGTTATGWIVATIGLGFDFERFAPLVVLFGALLKRFGRGPWADVGWALAGFALLLLGIAHLRSFSAAGDLWLDPADLGAGPARGLLLVLIGALATVVTQSSSAGVALAIAGVHAGRLAFGDAARLVIGMDIGTTSSALLASLGGTLAARRTGASHVLFNVLTAVVAVALLPLYAGLFETLAPGFFRRSPEIALVGFHSGFNLLGVVLILPFLGLFARLVTRLLPDRSPSAMGELDPALLARPALALEAAASAARRLARAVAADGAQLLRAGAEAGEATERLAPRAEELTRLRRFLGELGGDQKHAEETERQRELFLAVDHIGRLRRRLASGVPALDDEFLREARARTARACSGAPGLAHEASELARGVDTFRRRIAARVAAGEVAAEEAFARLDEGRRLAHALRHLSRIEVHLRAAGA